MTTETPFSPETIYREVLAAGEDWADKKAAYEAFDDNTDSILADITGQYMEGGGTKTACEARALSSKTYRDHLQFVAAARRDWLKAQVKYDSLKMLAELRRSQESTRRQEMRL
jgi:hypothetical protein